MKFNRLKKGMTLFMTAIGFAVISVSCNDDKTGNNSTTGTGENNMDSTASTITPDNTAAPLKKKSGKVSAAMVSDDATIKMEKDKMGYYNRTEVAPVFTGGQTSLEDYVNTNIQYPQDAIDNNIEGVVNVQFAVDEKGNISNVTSVGPKLGYGLEEEAIKVVSKMPSWTPGQVKGKNVKTWRTLPINYRLES